MMCLNSCRPCLILISGFANPNLTLVELSNQGTLFGFIDHDSESKPAIITTSADCPKASFGVAITMFSQLILLEDLVSFEVINFTVSMKSILR